MVSVTKFPLIAVTYPRGLPRDHLGLGLDLGSHQENNLGFTAQGFTD